MKNEKYLDDKLIIFESDKYLNDKLIIFKIDFFENCVGNRKSTNIHLNQYLLLRYQLYALIYDTYIRY